MTVNNSRDKKGLFANVDQVLTVFPNNELKVWLQIEAHNRTKQTIVLDENYSIPVKWAADLKAKDVKTKKRLHIVHDWKEERIEVGFAQGALLGPDEKLIWEISFTTRFCILETKDGAFTGNFVLEPLESYKKIPIKNHQINLRVVFKRPRNGDLFEKVIAVQSNNRRVPAKFAEKSKHVLCTFDVFNLKKGDKNRFTFSYQYQPAPQAGDVPLNYRQRLCSYAKNVCLSFGRAIPDVLARVLKELIVAQFRQRGAP